MYRGLHIVLPAGVATPSVARQRAQQWLDEHGWPDTPRDDLVLAISEAVSNSVEHGYGVTDGAVGPGTVEVSADLVAEGGKRWVVVTIRDEGRWRPQPAARENRRHGLPLMRACTEELTVDGTEQGTTVVLRSRAVPG